MTKTMKAQRVRLGHFVMGYSNFVFRYSDFA